MVRASIAGDETALSVDAQGTGIAPTPLPHAGATIFSPRSGWYESPAEQITLLRSSASVGGGAGRSQVVSDRGDRLLAGPSRSPSSGLSASTANGSKVVPSAAYCQVVGLAVGFAAGCRSLLRRRHIPTGLPPLHNIQRRSGERGLSTVWESPDPHSDPPIHSHSSHRMGSSAGHLRPTRFRRYRHRKARALYRGCSCRAVGVGVGMGRSSPALDELLSSLEEVKAFYTAERNSAHLCRNYQQRLEYPEQV
jgi:hypothetical protein